MSTLPRNRKSDRYAWLKGVATTVAATLILGLLGFAWNANSMYAKKEELKSVQITFTEKLDTILEIVHKLDKCAAEQTRDIGNLKENLTKETERALDYYKMLSDKLERFILEK